MQRRIATSLNSDDWMVIVANWQSMNDNIQRFESLWQPEFKIVKCTVITLYYFEDKILTH